MSNVTIYSTNNCPYCIKAKMLLQKKEAQYKEIDVSDDAEREKMTEKAGGKRSVPQIFINDKHVGGCDELYELENKGELDGLLA